MSSAPTPDDEFPIQDDETLSELVRTPSRTSADLQQHADLDDDLDPSVTSRSKLRLTGRSSRKFSIECGESRSV